MNRTSYTEILAGAQIFPWQADGNIKTFELNNTDHTGRESRKYAGILYRDYHRVKMGDGLIDH